MALPGAPGVGQAERMLIREATMADWPSIWPFFAEIVRAQETYAYDPQIDEATARSMWMLLEAPARTVVAVDERSAVLGTANMYPNRPGPGSHIASASFMVDSAARGRGAGRALGQYVVDWAKGSGYRGIQFNAVVETNEPAVHLWQALGFEVIGTAPEAFKHPVHGYIGLHVMFRRL